jgi:hypothetical protein
MGHHFTVECRTGEGVVALVCVTCKRDIIVARPEEGDMISVRDILAFLVDKEGRRQVRDVLFDLGLTGGLSCAVDYIDAVRPPMRNTGKAWYEYWRAVEPDQPHARYGADWNLESMGDSDLGEPVVAPFSGVVITKANLRDNWGLTVRILGLTRSSPSDLVVWTGSHLQEFGHIEVGQPIGSGAWVGDIGKGPGGMYAAHLHEHIAVGAVLGPRVWRHGEPFVDPVTWYLDNGVDEELMERLVGRDKQ